MVVSGQITTLTKYCLMNPKYQENIMKKWQSTQILGLTKVIFLPLMILTTTMGSSIASQIPPVASPTSEESTSCKSENQKEENAELQANQTGSNITEVLMNLNKTLEEMARIISKEKSSPSTQQLERLTTKKQDNSF